jgi:glycosyltransferase involved in cell wall biosynthesis
MDMLLSAVIITFNEERNIERCLRSLEGVADEIIVIDSFSTDQTEAICAKYSVTFIQHAFAGHIEQKNFAIDAARNSWILSLDADEALTPELRNSISEIKQNPRFLGYKFNRLTNYCGKWVRYCGWYPDTKVRLVHRDHARWQGTNPHDRLDMLQNEEIAHLSGDLLHYSYYTTADHLKQIEYFGKIASSALYAKGGRSNWLKIGIKTSAQFFKSFLLKRGFLDGRTGFTISRLSAYATYRKYKLLLDLQHQNEPN